MVSLKHAGFIVNYDNATSSDIIKLIELVKNTVFEKTGNKIELEIEIIGENTWKSLQLFPKCSKIITG